VLRRLADGYPAPRLEYKGFSLPEDFNAADFLLGPLDEKDATSAPEPHAEIASVAWLDAVSARIANLLMAEEGIVPGNRVLLRALNSPVLLAAMLGVLRAGAILVPTVPLLKEQELADILNVTRPGLALVGSTEDAVISAATISAGRQLRQISLDDLVVRSDAHPDHCRGHLALRDDPAMILFTSGTTGGPKAVVHGHGAIAATVRTFGSHIFRARPDDLVTGSPSLAFAYGIGLMMACPLAAGASVVFPERFGMDALTKTLNRYRTTMLVTVPTGYRKLLARNDWRAPALRRWFSAGEPSATGGRGGACFCFGCFRGSGFSSCSF